MSLLEVNKIIASIIVAILVVTIISLLGDLIVNINADKSKEVLSNAPEKLENYFVVPKVID